MWIELLKINFKEIAETIAKNPLIVIIIALLFSTGFFARKWTTTSDNCDIRITKIQLEKDSINGVAFDRLLLLYKERELREMEHKTIDSIIKNNLNTNKE